MPTKLEDVSDEVLVALFLYLTAQDIHASQLVCPLYIVIFQSNWNPARFVGGSTISFVALSALNLLSSLSYAATSHLSTHERTFLSRGNMKH